ncbi:HXXEE domain-containing protein [Mariniluteicoccus flavus]
MITWGAAALLPAWAVHDAEEWIAIPTRHQRVAIVVMGGLVGVAAVDGARTGGRSRLFRVAVEAYGLHGLGHLAASAATGGYTPGVITTPLTVLPYAWWARKRFGGPTGRDRLLAAALIPAALGVAHGVAALIERAGRRRCW